MPQKHIADRRRHNKEGRDNQPQVIIALAVTCDGMPVRPWVLPSDTADVTTRVWPGCGRSGSPRRRSDAD